MKKSYGTFQRLKSATHSWRFFSSDMSMIARFPNKKLPLMSMLILGSTCCGFVFYGHRRLTAVEVTSYVNNPSYSHLSSLLLATSARGGGSEIEPSIQRLDRRTFITETDEYYKRFKKLPKPPHMHDVLTRLVSAETRRKIKHSDRTNKILIIGDVHGCLDELKLLIAKASKDHNEGKQFAAVILVGDLCNKGPFSSEVIRFVREQSHMYSIRGNHDNAALEAALGDADRMAKERYAWVKDLTDQDVDWLASLPYTIRIPKEMISRQSKNDVLVVHAGLIPNVEMDEQDIKTMLTVRNLTPTYHDVRSKDPNTTTQTKYKYYNPEATEQNPIPVAKTWVGPELVIFGHDAKRGIQIEEHAIGLDSGCVYGNKLTGIVFPEKELVSIEALKAYSPIKNKQAT